MVPVAGVDPIGEARRSPGITGSVCMPSAYPWGALEPLPRAAVRVARGARQALGLEGDRFAAALSELLELPCELLIRKSVLGHVPASSQSIWLLAEPLAVGVLAEPALGSFLAARILRRAEPLANPEAPLSPALVAVSAALGVEAARRAGIATSVLGAPPIGEEALAAVLGDAMAVTPGRIEAPGQLARHYSPGKPVRLGAASAAEGEYLIGFGDVAGDCSLSPAGDLAEAAARLYACLHRAAASNRPRIAVAPIPDEGIGAAINDRLRRAAT